MKTPVRTRLLSALLSLVMLVSLLPVSVFAAEPASGTWEKVTEAQEDWSGQYLIVYEKGSLIMDGSLSALDKEGNKVDVTITDGKIVGDYAKYAFTIAPMTGGWSVQSASGKYISGKSGKNKIITGSTPELNTITFADGNVKIASNNTTLQYNAAATNGTRFRYYKSENQQPVALYKLSTVPARESGIVTDLTTLQNGDKVVVFNPANKKALSSVYNGFYNTGVDVELTGGKLTGYTDAELIEKGYTQQEIDNMWARIAGTEVHDSVDPEKSFGYQLYKRGQDLTAAAQAGLSPIAKQALGIVSSAGENLAVAAIDPAWVLPVLSAQGGAEAMGQSVEKGESAGKTLAGGLAKFGAGWAINSVGAADLAKTMGSDYAKNTRAGKLADMVRSVAADGTLAQQEVKFSDGAAACVILASGGYPVAYEKGKPISGLVDGQLPDEENVTVYHSGTAITEDGQLVTNGGRVLGGNGTRPASVRA